MCTSQRIQPIFKPTLSTLSRSLFDRPIKISSGVHLAALLLHNLSCRVISTRVNLYRLLNAYIYICTHIVHMLNVVWFVGLGFS